MNKKIIEIYRHYAIVHVDNEFPYLVCDMTSKDNRHAHFSDFKGAKMCMRFIKCKMQPSKSDFMKEAVERVVGDKVYHHYSIETRKQQYRNRSVTHGKDHSRHWG